MKTPEERRADLLEMILRNNPELTPEDAHRHSPTEASPTVFSLRGPALDQQFWRPTRPTRK
jgi:hypothetical protein